MAICLGIQVVKTVDSCLPVVVHILLRGHRLLQHGGLLVAL